MRSLKAIRLSRAHRIRERFLRAELAQCASPRKPRPPPTPAPRSRPRSILHFEQAPYPPEAEKLGLEANVILRLDIDKDGKVTAAAVTEPAGHGFDEAAAEAAKKFTFEPARRGTDADSRAHSLSLRIHPASRDPRAQPKQAPPAPVDSLRGMVLAADGDVPLAGATIDVEGPNGQKATVSTGADGTWKFTGLAAGHYKVTSPLPVSSRFTPKKTWSRERWPRSSTASTQGGGIEVTVRGERPPREVTRRTIEQREIDAHPRHQRRRAPLAPEPARRRRARRARGAPHRARLGPAGHADVRRRHRSCRSSTTSAGSRSVVPTEMLEKIDFYPGNFSAQYGRVMGGIVDVGMRTPNKDGKYHGLAQVDLIDGRVLAEGPFAGQGLELPRRRAPQLGRRVAQARARRGGRGRHRGARLLRLPGVRRAQPDQPLVVSRRRVRIGRSPRAP